MPIDAQDNRSRRDRFVALAVLLVVAVLGLLGAALATGWAASSHVQAQPPDIRFFRIGTGTTGGTYFPVGGLLANAISNPPGSRPCDRGGSCGVPGLIAVAEATSGSVENLARMQAGTLESALTQADIAFWAYHARNIYEHQPPFEGLRAIADLYTESLHIVVRADGPIRDIADLRGHVVSVGETGSGTYAQARLVLDAYGIGEGDIEARHLKPGPAADRLTDGEIDAFFIVGGPPVAAVADAAARPPVRLVGIDEAVLQKLTAAMPFFTAVTIPADTYDGVPAVRTIGVGAQWLVRADVPDEIVYGITTALWHPSTRGLLDAGHPEAARIQLATALNGLAVPLHPGAERFYRERGLLTRTANDAEAISVVPKP